MPVTGALPREEIRLLSHLYGSASDTPEVIGDPIRLSCSGSRRVQRGFFAEIVQLPALTPGGRNTIALGDQLHVAINLFSPDTPPHLGDWRRGAVFNLNTCSA
jgi:hypothetical protein